MKADTTRKSNAPQVRELKASELDAVAGAVNTGIPAD